MHSFTLLALAFAPFTLAQSSSAAAPLPPVPTALPSGTHAIAVGINSSIKAAFAFNPSQMNVPAGDTVEFFFYPKAHGVVQAAFNNPCHPASDSAFSSGIMPVASGINPQSFKVTINDTNPIWFYCPQTILTHCQQGMVGVINPPSSGSQTFAAFQAAAKKVTENSTMPDNVQGGVVGTADGVSASASGGASASASATGTAAGSASGSSTATGSSSSVSAFTGAAVPIPVAGSSSIFGAFLALLGVFVGL